MKKFKVYHQDYLGAEPKIFDAYDKEDAAKKYAEYFNSNNDYSLMNSEEIICIENEKGSATIFTISAEQSIRYNVNEIF